MASAGTFLERYHEDVDEFINHYVRVAGDENYVSFVNVETKAVDEHTFTREAEKI
jgi:hypothetical protein